MALLVTKPEIPMHDQLIGTPRHTPHATRHTPHATRHTPHATRHTPHATRRTPHTTRHTPHVTGPHHGSLLTTMMAHPDAEEKEDEFRVMLEQLGHSVEADRPKSGGVPKIQHGELFKEIGQMVEVMASEIEKELEGGFISFTKAVKREYPKVFPKVEEEPADEMVEKVRGFFCKRLDAFNKQLGASIIDKISELHDPWRDFCSQPSECVVDDNLIKLLKKKLASLSPRPSKVDNTG
jgi:hypothetical protein